MQSTDLDKLLGQKWMSANKAKRECRNSSQTTVIRASLTVVFLPRWLMLS